MDDIDTLLTTIINSVTESPLDEEEKADIFARISAGMHHLVWPILLKHMPESELKDVTTHPETMTLSRYADLIESSLRNPATPKEIHDEIYGALEEVEQLLTRALPKAQKAQAA
jgi:hypothetical protein